MTPKPDPTPGMFLLLGPTAVGKTAFSITLAGRLGAEILYADSMAVYRGMDIGTAKPTVAERCGIPHHLIDVAHPSEPFSVRRYLDLALPILEEKRRSGIPLIVVAGTGLYIRALTEGLVDADPADDETLRILEERAREEGAERLHRELTGVDPHAAARIHPRDTKRIIRALSVFLREGRPLSAIQQRPCLSRRLSFVQIGLTRNRSELRDRIHRRVDQMIRDGLVEETRRLLEQSPSRTALQSLGYKEIADVLAGHEPLESAVNRIKARTCQFAKRQMTWFKKMPGVRWIDVSGAEHAEAMLELWDAHPVK